MRRWIWAATLGMAMGVTGCQRSTPPGAGDLQAIRDRGELIVVTRAAPTTFYQNGEGLQGPEFDMVEDFARHLGVRPRYLVAGSEADALRWLEQGQADLAAAGISRTPSREARFRFGPVYRQIDQQVVCHRDGPHPNDIGQLSGLRVRIGVGTSHAERLQQMAVENPDLHWETVEATPEQLLEQVWRREIDCTVVDSPEMAVNRRSMPELEVAFDLASDEPLAWALPLAASRLQAELERWMHDYRGRGILAAQEDRYFGHLDDAFDYLDATTYRGRIFSRLPRYRSHFRRAEARFDLPWTLLAAVAYHESNWDPKAVSPSGVRGLMMLTASTARALGVNRLDPEDSIQGAARYLAELRDGLPPEVPEPDRTWMALAAYNVGLGHLEDARQLAIAIHLDPNRWNGLKEAFSKLSERSYARFNHHGALQGDDPVRYVERVRDLHAILEVASAEGSGVHDDLLQDGARRIAYP